MAESYNNLIEYFTGLGGLFSWLPDPLPAIISAAIVLIVTWWIIALIIKIVGALT